MASRSIMVHLASDTRRSPVEREGLCRQLFPHLQERLMGLPPGSRRPKAMRARNSQRQGE